MISLKTIPPFITLLLLLSGCSRNTNISEIHENLREFTNHRVTVSGTVTSVFDLEVITYYILSDDTGEIPVVTNSQLPSLGENVTVTGTVRVIVLVDKTLPAIEQN
ncbi:MAG: hypothetical protein AMXMBFR48_15070 [Ignavibacteriales bacterium]